MSVRLVDLHPGWIDHGDRKGLGVIFSCMVGNHRGPNGDQPCKIRNFILFANPLDGGAAWPGDSEELLQLVYPDDHWNIGSCGTDRWTRTGDNFESLSMTPSVNAHSCGHLWLTAGEFK